MLLYIHFICIIIIIIIDISTEGGSCAMERSSGGENEWRVGDNL